MDLKQPEIALNLAVTLHGKLFSLAFFLFFSSDGDDVNRINLDAHRRRELQVDSGALV